MSILPFSSTRPSNANPLSLAAGVAALWTSLLQAWRLRRADHAMHLLSDEMLHDIGVARSEIENVTRHGRPGRR